MKRDESKLIACLRSNTDLLIKLHRGTGHRHLNGLENMKRIGWGKKTELIHGNGRNRSRSYIIKANSY